ncbi:membrane protein [Longispora fulva]|uniref:Bax inhibitor-1/YccA family protein n=1 Tax=Longispora fulva TaxID=619741 RepID=UPI0018CB13A6|nr:Bax inhibitor-1/YccA family protein [Longispora fulva]GIG58434.1 membrane protein [Longispora fulva]
MKSSNGALGRVVAGAVQDRNSYTQPGYPAPYGAPGYGAPEVRTMTMDDVVVRTVILLAVTGAAGAFSWTLLPDALALPVVLGAALIGLVLGLVISFKRVTNPFVISAYAVTQGLVLGIFSRIFESFYHGIVLQAVVATFGIFFGMAMLYKFKVIRNSPRFTKVIVGATIGLVGLMLVNLVAYFFSDNGIGIRAGMTGKVGWLPIVFSLVVIVVAALSFVIDFDMIEQGIRYGMPEKYAWAMGFGLLVGLIWLYMEVLRMLSYLRR